MPLRILSALVLILLPCGGDSTCPEDLTVIEYGHAVLINCSSTNSPVFTCKINATDWNLRPQCKIQLNDSHECTQDLKITVYKKPKAVNMFPISDEKHWVEGTEYELQCNISEVAPVQNLTVRWYKDKVLIKTHSFTNTTKSPPSESSILKFRSNRTDHGAEVQCEAQLDFRPCGPRLPPFLSSAHKVSVHYPPDIANKTTEVHFVEEDSSVTLSCEADSLPPPNFNWTRDGVYMHEYTNNLTITKVNTNASYTCIASNYLGNVTKKILVYQRKNATTTPIVVITPADSPRNDCSLTLTPAKLVVKIEDPASVNCSTSNTDVDIIGWEVTQGGVTKANKSSVSWSVQKLNDFLPTPPKCYVTLGSGTQCEKSLHITVYKLPDNVSVSASPDAVMTEGKEHQLMCYISNVAPAQNLTVIWFQENKRVMEEKYSNSTLTPITVHSFFNVTAKREYNGTRFHCKAELHLGSDEQKIVPNVTSYSYTAIVNYKPLMIDCPSSYNGEEDKFSLNMLPCKADGNPPPVVHWFYQGKRINVSQPLSRNHTGEYTAELFNKLGRESTSINITIEYVPFFDCETHHEVRENDKLSSGCEPKGIPTPTITWLKDGKVFAPSHWTKDDSGKYVLRAENKYGTVDHTLYVDVQFVPKFKQGNERKEVTTGENVTFVCEAEGNPDPRIQWKYTTAANVDVTPEGRQKTILITGATSTNAGVYICIATNNVGSVTRSVTLQIRDKTTGVSYIIVVAVTLSVILLIIIIIFILCDPRKRGQYNFVPDHANDANDASGIPMTSKSNGVEA
ncbi:hemicentin-1 isoform X2 [Echeneis naucrates]|uniref:hemicentin-1 isoform X2 n=1 Tax=Echeneis naucrates TaxID=173247 RepID=UPI0011144B4B|nr:hemicentin-1-like isoform X2 [Echeneis naucrates]